MRRYLTELSMVRDNSKVDILHCQRQMDTLLLEVLREQEIKGLKDDTNFQGEAYRVAIDAINKEFKCNVTKEKIINRLKTLKEIMNLALDALKKSGISWNDTTKKIEAGPEVWNELIKAKPKMKRVRDKEIPNLELLRDIYEKDRATGMKARTAKERLLQWEEANTIDEVDQLQAENVVILENLEDPHTSSQLENSNGASFSNKTVKKPPSKINAKRKLEDRKFEDAKGKNSDAIQEGLKNVNESMAEIARALHATHTRIYSAIEIFAELEKHGVPDEKLLVAAKFLKASNEEADTFFDCPDRLKRQWLESNGFLV